MIAKDAGEVNIIGEEINLYNFSKGKKLNIHNMVSRWELYESLDNHTITADFYMSEGIDLPSEFPMGGEEVIEIKIQTPSRDTCVYEFFVESVVGMKTNTESNMRSYILRCTTKDFLSNAVKVYTKRYKDLLYHEALTECIQQDLGATTPLVTIESTKGKFDYVVNNKRPFQVVDVIKERAVSAEGNKSSVFVFYQDNKGYHFQTVEKLIEDRKGGADGKEFVYDTSNRIINYDEVINVRNILQYETVGQGSSVRKVMKGAMYNQVREFDLYRGTYFKKEEYINPGMHTMFKKTDDPNDFNSGDYNGFTTEMPGVTRMAIKDDTRPEMEHNANIHFARAFYERMFQYRVRCRVYGDTSIRVGDVIKLKLPIISGTTGSRPQGKVFSEKYIITNLKHVGSKVDSGRFEHFMVFECAKPNQFTQPLG
jgi:hypothetical protein